MTGTRTQTANPISAISQTIAGKLLPTSSRVGPSTLRQRNAPASHATTSPSGTATNSSRPSWTQFGATATALC
jgi:hypothetical protein